MRDQILHLADLHLGAPLPAALAEDFPQSAQSLGRSREELLERIAAAVLDSASRIGMVLVAGDLFHRYDPPEETVQRVRRALARLSSVVPVIIVPGNHDELSYSRCVYRQGDWPGVVVRNATPAEVFSGTLESGLNVSIVSAAFEAGKVPPGSLIELPPAPEKDFTIAALHGTVVDHFSEMIAEGERCFRVSHARAAQAGYHYLALGHFHRRSSWAIGGCRAAYPAPVVGAWPDDPGAASLLVIEPTSSAPRLITWNDPEVVGTAWRHMPTKLEADATPAELAQRITEEFAGDSSGMVIPVIELAGSVSRESFADELRRELIAASRPAVVIDRKLSVHAPVDIEQAAREPTLRGEFVRQWQSWCQRETPDSETAQWALTEGILALRQQSQPGTEA